jgi:hypothetical protein
MKLIACIAVAAAVVGPPLQCHAAGEFEVVTAKAIQSPAGLKRGARLNSGAQLVLGPGGLLVVEETRGCRLHQVIHKEGRVALTLSPSSRCNDVAAAADVRRRIDEGQPLAERVALTAEGKADGQDVLAGDACVTLSRVSEEGDNSRRCPAGYLLSGMKCSGGYCDNKVLKCCPYLDGNADAQMRNYHSEWISEESGGGRSNQYSTRDFINGLSCRGAYCDDVFPHAVSSPRFRNAGACRWTRYFSDEPPAGAQCGGDTFVAGIRCRGSYCDDLSLQCCQLQRR